jgi:hypothetical protein
MNEVASPTPGSSDQIEPAAWKSSKAPFRTLSRWRFIASVGIRRALRLGVGRTEPLGRFLTSSSQFAKTKKRVKPAGMMPGNDGKTSVFRIGGLTDSAVLRIGRQRVEGTRTLHGWGVFEASAVLDVGLRLDPDDVPPRHANIVGWPDEKDANWAIAQELSALASDLKLVVRP